MRKLLYGLEHDDHHNGGAVGVGNDPAGPYERVGGVAFRHYKGNVGVHPECAGVIYHYGAVTGDSIREFTGSSGAGGGERNVDIFEVVVVAQEFDFDLLAAECILAAGAALRAE